MLRFKALSKAYILHFALRFTYLETEFILYEIYEIYEINVFICSYITIVSEFFDLS